MCMAVEKWVRRGYSQAGTGQITWGPKANGRYWDYIQSALEALGGRTEFRKRLPWVPMESESRRARKGLEIS